MTKTLIKFTLNIKNNYYNSRIPFFSNSFYELKSAIIYLCCNSKCKNRQNNPLILHPIVLWPIERLKIYTKHFFVLFRLRLGVCVRQKSFWRGQISRPRRPHTTDIMRRRAYWSRYRKRQSVHVRLEQLGPTRPRTREQRRQTKLHQRYSLYSA